MKRPLLLVMVLACGLATAFAQASRPKVPARAVKPPTAEQPKFKAIWEPVNYNEDIRLFDVYFVSKDEGWVTGAAGTILHTKDGGNKWTAELGGDPHAQGEELKHEFFTDATHGWAQAWNTLFRSTDGENWQQAGDDVRGDVFFVSDVKGFRAYGGKIFATDDGGNKWREVLTCRAKMEVQGLTQDKSCDVWALYFPSARVGYAMGDARIMAKTEDGGATWNIHVGPEEPNDQRVYDVFFLDENTGFHVRSGSRLYRTTDGGQTWQGIVAKLEPGYPKVKFADHEVGWSCVGSTWAYTLDGGKHWTTRQVRFPAPVAAFSLPARDRGYVVGEHGMIYRYRVVPIDYTSKGMLDASMMPTADSR